jgi:pimeloyl-ACP methyl ester carboxylesterase
VPITSVPKRPVSTAFLKAEAELWAHYGVEPRSLELTLAEPALRLRALETGSGEPVLFMHGITLCAVHWAPLLARLDSLRCIALDMPGHGGSEAVDYRGVDLRRWHTTMLSRCLDSLGLGSAHLVGHSYGAMLALWLALDSPERVRSVVAFGTPSVAFGAWPDATLRLLALPRIGPLLLSLPSPLFAYRRLLSMSLGRHAIERAPAELVGATYLATRRPGFARTASTYLREQFRGARARPQRYVIAEDELARIDRPVLVVWGEDDRRYQPIAEGKSRTALIPRGRFEAVCGGHEPWLDDVDSCARLLSRFLADQRERPSESMN